MLLTVADPDLARVLCAQALLVETWRDAAREVMMLLQVLRSARPTLADVIAVGMVVLTASPVTRSAIVLTYRRVSLVALGLREDGSVVQAAPDHAEEVSCLEIQSLQLAPAVQAAR